MADTREIDLLADLLDGTLDAAEAPAELTRLLGLADAVRDSVTLVPPTPAFREALREQVLSDVASSIASGAAGGAGAATTAVSAVTPFQAIAAAVAAATVLAGGGIATLAPGAAPGDALYDAKRGIESAQLAVGGVERDVELLLDLTTERVEEALGLLDTAVVLDLLDQSEAHLDRALSLLGELDQDVAGRLLTDAVAARTSALDALAADTTDLTVGVRADQLRDSSRALLPSGADLDPSPAGVDGSTDDTTQDGSPAPDATPAGEDTGRDPATTPDAGSGQDTVDDGADTTDDVTDTAEDTVDDVTDTVDDLLDDAELDVPVIIDEALDLGEDLLGP